MHKAIRLNPGDSIDLIVDGVETINIELTADTFSIGQGDRVYLDLAKNDGEWTTDWPKVVKGFEAPEEFGEGLWNELEETVQICKTRDVPEEELWGARVDR